MDPQNHIYTTNQVPNANMAQPVGGKKSPMEMVKQGLLDINNKFRQPPKLLVTSVIKYGIIFLVFIILLIVLVAAFNILKNQITPTVLVSPTATPASVVLTPPPSKYATDPQVQKLDADIKTLDSELSRTDIEEKNLKPRPFTWDINFK